MKHHSVDSRVHLIAVFALLALTGLVSLQGCAPAVDRLILSGNGCTYTPGGEYGTEYTLLVSVSNCQAAGAPLSFEISTEPAGADLSGLVLEGGSSNLCVIGLSPDKTRLLVTPLAANHIFYPSLELGNVSISFILHTVD